MTNLQFWVADSPYILRPTDSLMFPAVTNLGVNVWKDRTTKVEIVRLDIRSTGFEMMISANVLFVPVPTNSTLKPFLIPGKFVGKLGEGGHFQPAISEKEMEEMEKQYEGSQK